MHFVIKKHCATYNGHVLTTLAINLVSMKHFYSMVDVVLKMVQSQLNATATAAAIATVHVHVQITFNKNKFDSVSFSDLSRSIFPLFGSR